MPVPAFRGGRERCRSGHFAEGRQTPARVRLQSRDRLLSRLAPASGADSVDRKMAARKKTPRKSGRKSIFPGGRWARRSNPGSLDRGFRRHLGRAVAKGTHGDGEKPGKSEGQTAPI